MIIICLFTFLFSPLVISTGRWTSRENSLICCYVLLCAVSLAGCWVHTWSNYVCVAYREEPICFSHVYLSKRERKGFEPNTNAVSYFGLLLHIPRQPRSLPCLTRWQMGEREREARELLLYMWLAIRPIYVCTGAVDRRQKTFNHRFFSPAGAGLYFILCL